MYVYVRLCVCVCVSHAISHDKGANLQADELTRICFSKLAPSCRERARHVVRENGRDSKVVASFKSQ